MIAPAIFYWAVVLGLLSYLAKKYLAHDGWSVRQFIHAELSGVINSVWVVAALAYVIPDAVVAANEVAAVASFAVKYPHLMEKITVLCGGLVGFTGGSIALDLLPMLSNLPIIGPVIDKVVTYFKKKPDPNDQP
jgi:hypothetical protein